MIYGTGIDLVKISRMADVIERWGNRFVRRIFTAGEEAFCYKRAAPPSAFALRFAAKEAFSKALGLGMTQGIRWRDIEVFHYTGGKPGLKLHGKAREICAKENISAYHLSLSDEGEYGMAMVLLER